MDAKINTWACKKPGSCLFNQSANEAEIAELANAIKLHEQKTRDLEEKLRVFKSILRSLKGRVQSRKQDSNNAKLRLRIIHNITKNRARKSKAKKSKAKKSKADSKFTFV